MGRREIGNGFDSRCGIRHAVSATQTRAKDSDVRSFNTLDALIRLADFGLLHADEYRLLSGGYVFLRTIEHSLQLMHYKQTHAMPDDRRQLAWLARRLDFRDVDLFVSHYEQHCRAIRTIYDRYLGDDADADWQEQSRPHDPVAEHLERMEPLYQKWFDSAAIERHATMMKVFRRNRPPPYTRNARPKTAGS